MGTTHDHQPSSVDHGGGRVMVRLPMKHGLLMIWLSDRSRRWVLRCPEVFGGPSLDGASQMDHDDEEATHYLLKAKKWNIFFSGKANHLISTQCGMILSCRRRSDDLVKHPWIWWCRGGLLRQNPHHGLNTSGPNRVLFSDMDGQVT